MSRWFRFHADAMRNPKVARLTDKEFRAAFAGAMNGGETPLSPFMRGPYSRPLANEWKLIRAAIFERDNYTCTYCAAHGVKLECDHIAPVSKGGSSEPDNLTTACFSCNRAKAGKALDAWLASRETV